MPLGKSTEEAYQIIDRAIAVIDQSGLKYEVCPFETVIEGSYERVMQVLDEIQNECSAAGADTILVNMKLHRSFKTDLAITDKTGKYLHTRKSD